MLAFAGISRIYTERRNHEETGELFGVEQLFR